MPGDYPVLGAVDIRISGGLKRFKEFIERRGHETGAWRGEVGMTPQTPARPVNTTDSRKPNRT